MKEHGQNVINILCSSGWTSHFPYMKSNTEFLMFLGHRMRQYRILSLKPSGQISQLQSQHYTMFDSLRITPGFITANDTLQHLMSTCQQEMADFAFNPDKQKG